MLTTSDRIAHIVTLLQRLCGQLRQRPYRPDSVRPLALHHPGCARGCSTCYLECAVLPKSIAWWEQELTQLEAPGVVAFYIGEAGTC